jgi:hypothetical protein
MTVDNFDNALRALLNIKPFRIFTVELQGGERFEVDSPMAIATRDGVAMFVAQAESRTFSITKA